MVWILSSIRRVDWSVIGSPILVQRVNYPYIRVHVVSDVLLILLSLVFQLTGYFFSEDGHMLVNTFLDLLLNKISNSFTHVVRNLLQLRIVLSIEDVSLEI